MSQPMYIRAPKATGDPTDIQNTFLPFDPTVPFVICFRYGERPDTQVTDLFTCAIQCTFAAKDWLNDPHGEYTRSAIVAVNGETLRYGGDFNEEDPAYKTMGLSVNPTSYGNIVMVYNPKDGLDIYSVYANTSGPILKVIYSDLTANKWPFSWIKDSPSNMLEITQYGADVYLSYSLDDACCLGIFIKPGCPDPSGKFPATCDPVMSSFCSRYGSDNLPWCACVNAAQGNPEVTSVDLSCFTACSTPGAYTPSAIQPCTSQICGNIIGIYGDDNVINDAAIDASCRQQAANQGGESNTKYIIIAIIIILVIAFLAISGAAAYFYFE
jgi:hypothetical protein